MVLQQPQAPRGSPVPRAELAHVVEATVVGLGYDLADCEVVARGRLVRVFIERPASAAGEESARVTVDDCERVTRQLQRVFEVEGVDYDRLEVSSPGLDRVLKTPAHFRRFVGCDVELRLRAPEAGRKRFSGVLRGVDESEVEVEVEGARRRFAIAALEKARLIPKF
jgi:ribosome maturation factor RimP